MPSEEALDKFRKIYSDHPDIAIHRGSRVTESDTRANILDRLIHEVLGWPRDPDVVKREPFANPGFIDYHFHNGRPVLLLEAKSADVSFHFPYRKSRRRTLKIESSLLTDKELKAAIVQAQGYCNDTGCRFAVATNGYSFVFFRAITEGAAWKDGSAQVFYDPRDIQTNFTEFWNLLSYEAVLDGKLDASFRTNSSPSRGYYKPLDDRVDSESLYDRNPLNIYIKPYVDKFFGDIVLQDNVEILNKCYVYSRPIQLVDAELELAIEDQIPRFAASAKPSGHTFGDPGGAVGRQITSAVLGRAAGGSLILLMGGIGSGKSTFCRRFFRVVAPGLITENGRGLLVYVDFLGAPDEPNQLQDFLWRAVAKSLKDADPTLSKRQTLEQVFKAEIDLTYEVYGKEDPLTAGRVSDLIFQYYQDSKKFGERALTHCAGSLRMPIVVFDNVDQLKLPTQVELFTSAQRFANVFGCVSLIVLREESYSAALLKRHLTATTIRPYHLASPSFRDVLATRIKSSITEAETRAAEPGATDEQKQYGSVVTLFALLERSVLGRNHNILRLVGAIAYGNMRLALTLFNTFITSGATDIMKILRLYTERGNYTVPFHEFAKSVMLGDYLYYRESRSLFANLFHVSRKPNASHFTALRILNYLSTAPTSQGGGREFLNLQTLLVAMAENFGNEEDCKETILRLVAVDRQLIDLDTRRTDSLEGASALRATAAGMYYLRFLANAFSYCDLAWHDTAFDDRPTCDALSKLMHSTDMNDRFYRVDIFLYYLRVEEENEFASQGLNYEEETVWGPFIPRIKRHVENEKVDIRRRLKIPEPTQTHAG